MQLAQFKQHSIMYFDTHCHIQFTAYNDDRDDVIDRCISKNTIMNVVGTQIPTSQAAVALAESHESIVASVGIHPIQHHAVDVVEEMSSFRTRAESWDDSIMKELASHERVVAIGETGLDKYHIPPDVDEAIVFDSQVTLFKKHVSLAQEVNKPLVIHVREAHDDMITLLQNMQGEGTKPRGTVHCFTGSWDHAQAYMSMGLYLGFTGIITYPPRKSDPNTKNMLEETIRNMPLDRILVETDAPYLAPQVRRGKRNEPWLVRECVARIADIRGMDAGEVASITTTNARRLFAVTNELCSTSAFTAKIS
jgi:TatD DNase family protein